MACVCQGEKQGPLSTGRARLRWKQKSNREEEGISGFGTGVGLRETSGEVPSQNQHCKRSMGSPKPDRPKSVLQPGRAWLNQQGEGSDRHRLENPGGRLFNIPGTPAAPHKHEYIPMFGFSTPKGPLSGQKIPGRFTLDTPECATSGIRDQTPSVRTRQEKNRRTGAFTICEAQTLRESTLRRPKGQGRLGDRAKTKEDVHFWYLCRAMRCLRYFEMQWGFVNAQVESSIQEYKQKAESELSKLALATCSLQSKLGHLKEQKTQFETVERSELLVSGIGPILDDLKDQKVPFLHQWKTYKQILVSHLENLPVGDGIRLGGSTVDDSLGMLANVMQGILDNLERLDNLFLAKSHGSQDQSSDMVQNIKVNALSQDIEDALGLQERRVLKDQAQRVVSSGILSEDMSRLVFSHGKMAKELHSLVASTAKKQIILSSLRLQASQLNKLEDS